MTRFTLPAPHDRHSVPTGLFIGGEWRDAKKTVAVINPSNGKSITEVADGDEVTPWPRWMPPQAAGPGWAATAPRQRAEILRAML